jgi:hypothetical protein
MLCAPLLNSLRSDSPTRADDTINRVSLEQLRAGILERCVPGRLNAPYVALIDFTMHHPFRHCLSRRLMKLMLSLMPAPRKTVIGATHDGVTFPVPTVSG